jgi:hypothetical protein
MPKDPDVRGVALPAGHTGSSFLHALLRSAVAAFPDALAGARVPESPKAFKASFGEDLARFEAARAASPDRAVIAAHIRHEADAAMRFVAPSGERPLAQAVREDRPAPALEVHATKGPGRLRPTLVVEGATIGGDLLRGWLRSAGEHHHLTDAAGRYLARLVDRADADGGELSLRGERFALLGAGAELAPTRMLLAAGADVLWVDVRPPPADLLASEDLGGRLIVPGTPGDLLADPAGIAAAVRAFAADGPVHLGMYAYAGGEGQEWRLTASMNAIAAALGPEVVRSVALLISPTTAAVATPADAAVAAERRAQAAWWKRALGRAGLLHGGGVPCGAGRVGHVIVPLQGASYQAAQYVGKIIAAETFATSGLDPADPRPITVSANVAPITATRSLLHPVFQAGFLGASMWDVLISPPELTRAVNGLLMVADLTDPERAAQMAALAPSERAAAVFSEQIHGGVFAQPWAMYSEIRVSAVYGLIRRPSLLVALARGR